MAITKRGYKEVYMPKHSRARSNGLVKEHLVIVEKALGKPLPVGAVVHHVDENPGNNDNANLVICQDQDYHLLLHRRLNALRETGDPQQRKCCICHTYDMQVNLRYRTSRWSHAKCEVQYTKEYKAGRRRRLVA